MGFDQIDTRHIPARRSILIGYNKDWLAQCQDNVTEWDIGSWWQWPDFPVGQHCKVIMCVHCHKWVPVVIWCYVFQWCSTPITNLSLCVRNCAPPGCGQWGHDVPDGRCGGGVAVSTPAHCRSLPSHGASSTQQPLFAGRASHPLLCESFYSSLATPHFCKFVFWVCFFGCYL